MPETERRVSRAGSRAAMISTVQRLGAVPIGVAASMGVRERSMPGRMRQLAYLSYRSLRNDGLDFLALWWRLQASVPGWLGGADGRWLYALAHHGPAQGAIVEIGSAWGRSTICLASGTKKAGRERVLAIDPHTGDPEFLAHPGFLPTSAALEDGIQNASGAWWPPRRDLGLAGAQQNPKHVLSGEDRLNSLPVFESNLRRFGVEQWVIPIVSTSHEAASTYTGGAIRLLFLDGLHTYAGVKTDIDEWIPRVVRGGVIVFDDYFNVRDGVGVRQAVEELVATGSVGALQHGLGLHVWVTKR